MPNTENQSHARHKKIQIIVATATLLAGIGIYTLLASPPAKSERQTKKAKPVSLSVVQPHTGAYNLDLNLHGPVVSRGSFELLSEAGGRIVEADIPLLPGSKFEAGQILLRISDQELSAQVRQGRVELQAATGRALPQIEQDYPAQKAPWRNFYQGISPDQPLPKLPELVGTRLQGFLSGSGLLAVYYRVQALEARYDKQIVRLPFGGVIDDVYAPAGSVVRTGAPLFTVTGLEQLEIETGIRAALLTLVPNVGSPATAVISGALETFEVVLQRTGGAIQRRTQTVPVYFSFRNNTETVLPGSYAEVKLMGRKVPEVAKIPSRALHDGRWVYAFEASTAVGLKRYEVELVADNEEAALVKGLKNGLLVVDDIRAISFTGMNPPGLFAPLGYGADANWDTAEASEAPAH